MEPQRPGWAPRSCKLDAWNFLHFVIFDDVAFANIVELPKSDTAFEALADFRDIVGETTQRANRKVFLDDPVAPHQPSLGVAPNEPERHIQPGNGPGLGERQHR